MSKQKGNDKGAEQPPPRLFRTFNEYPVEQVMEVARMLYALRPFAPDEKSEIKWNSLVQQAFAFLDKLRNACETIAKRRRATDAIYRREEKRSADAEALPERTPVSKALKIITGDKHLDRAERKFTQYVSSEWRQHSGDPHGEPHKASALLRRWRKIGGVPSGDLTRWRDAFHAEWSAVKREQYRDRVRKRKPWEGERVSKALSKTAAKIA